MRYLSMFSGIEAASVAWEPLGWTPAAFCEIEPFPSAVLRHRFPHVPNLGDVTKADFDAIGPVDLIVFGSPCQSFSIAGKRLGLDDPRGNLALYALSVVKRLRPRWFLFENVPGLLSSSGGRDFGAFLATVGECGYQCAWRVLDAQHFGVPQRRRRVFVVGHLGDWRRAAAVLFERHSLQGHSPPRRETRQGIAGGFETGPSGGRFTDIAPTLDARSKDGPIRNQLGAGVIDWPASVAPTLNAHFGDKWGLEDQHALHGAGLFVPDTYAIQERAISENPNAGPDGAGYRDDGMAYTLEARTVLSFKPGQSEAAGGIFVTEDYAPTLQASNNGSTAVPAIAISSKDHGADAGETSPTLRAGGHSKSHANAGVPPAVAFDLRGREGGAQFEGPHDSANIRAASGGSSRSYVASTAVRRLTPKECERLQGFPDNWTAVPHRGKPAADGPRYKALGNSMAVPVMAWIGQRIASVEAILEAEGLAA